MEFPAPDSPIPFPNPAPLKYVVMLIPMGNPQRPPHHGPLLPVPRHTRSIHPLGNEKTPGRIMNVIDVW
ncbi:hypothetical protein BGZ63DRAFT_381960 [Mariannaea sp. PMI_226]|nr:hypothetical protein BGZ63DRAFT_381960 [Mariannaea sp. PMI_226]